VTSARVSHSLASHRRPTPPPSLGSGLLSWQAGWSSKFLAVEPDALPHLNVDLRGRRAECDALDGFLTTVRGGRSRVLVLHGEPGVGKTALLDYVAQRATGCRVIRAGGVESEMELAYAVLHQLCAPMLDRLDNLPSPQRDALGTAFGLNAQPAPDRFLIGLAVLSMFADAAEVQPLVCLIDDLQWIDHASVQALRFVARRLFAESVGLVLASRVHDPDLGTLPTMQVRGLPQADARALLDAALTAPLDERVRDCIVAETRGNPLALLQVPHGLSVQDLAGGFGLPSAKNLSTAMEENFRRGVEGLPEKTRRLLLLAAAEPLGDPALVLAAAAQLGIGADAAAPTASGELAEFGVRVRFRHPLVRSAIYRSAPIQERRLVHQALADVTDANSDPDRRAWHRAQATDGPDEDIATELERSAARARARGGMAAAAAFLERATMLTPERSRRVERALAAASSHLDAGAFDAALDLLAAAEGGPLSDFQHARTDLIRARHAFVTDRGSDASPLLLKAAERLAPIDAALSRATLLEALRAAMFAGRLGKGSGVLDVARAAQDLSPPAGRNLTDLLLEGFAAYFTAGYAAGLPILRRAVKASRRTTPSDKQVHWLAGIAALHVWDDEAWDVLTARHVELDRAAGALTELTLALNSRVVMLMFAGELTAAELLIQEARTVTEATGDNLTDPAMSLAAFRGRRTEASAMIETTTQDVVRRGEGLWLSAAEFAAAVLNNGVGNYTTALAAARRAVESTDIALSGWAAVELIEAAARSGKTDTATSALAWLTEMTSASGTDWAHGVEARSRALLSAGAEAERLYRDAIDRLGRTRIRTELARAHLLYGEWLRRARRRTDARAQLRIAHEMLEAMGMEAFAERARRELQATGETARKRTAVKSNQQLTAQEAQIAKMAREGLSNPEIATRLFISAKTVEYHLAKVFTKLGISSRVQLNYVFPTNQ
jgi:DNA-binding CsgD family transcriptional regulator